MRELKFTVNKQKLSKDGDYSHIVKGSKSYLKCCVTFDDNDWIKYRKIAVFFDDNKKEYARKIEPDGTCNVPDEVTDGSYFKMKIVGVLPTDTDKRIYTTTEVISQEG